MALEELGYTDEQIERMLSDKRRADGQRVLDEVLGRAKAAPASPRTQGATHGDTA